MYDQDCKLLILSLYFFFPLFYESLFLRFRFLTAQFVDVKEEFYDSLSYVRVTVHRNTFLDNKTN